MAARGDADAVLAHAPADEARHVASGDLVEGRAVMHNRFVLVGPPDDPAGAATARDVPAALAAVAARGRFVSRGDRSGTHAKELELWTAAGIDPATVSRREETGQGMGATLAVADQKAAYTLADTGTFLAQKKRLRLVPLPLEDPRLRNPYHGYVVNPEKHPKVRAAGARRLVAFLVAPATQRDIREFRRAELGESLFLPDAVPEAAR
jgi:tungstate transport system substrate-binding protein